MKCKNCGGNLYLKDGYWSCESCNKSKQFKYKISQEEQKILNKIQQLINKDQIKNAKEDLYELINSYPFSYEAYFKLFICDMEDLKIKSAKKSLNIDEIKNNSNLIKVYQYAPKDYNRRIEDKVDKYIEVLVKKGSSIDSRTFKIYKNKLGNIHKKVAHKFYLNHILYAYFKCFSKEILENFDEYKKFLKEFEKSINEYNVYKNLDKASKVVLVLNSVIYKNLNDDKNDYWKDLNIIIKNLNKISKKYNNVDLSEYIQQCYNLITQYERIKSNILKQNDINHEIQDLEIETLSNTKLEIPEDSIAKIKRNTKIVERKTEQFEDMTNTCIEAKKANVKFNRAFKKFKIYKSQLIDFDNFSSETQTIIITNNVDIVDDVNVDESVNNDIVIDENKDKSDIQEVIVSEQNIDETNKDTKEKIEAITNQITIEQRMLNVRLFLEQFFMFKCGICKNTQLGVVSFKDRLASEENACKELRTNKQEIDNLSKAYNIASEFLHFNITSKSTVSKEDWNVIRGVERLMKDLKFKPTKEQYKVFIVNSQKTLKKEIDYIFGNSENSQFSIDEFKKSYPSGDDFLNTDSPKAKFKQLINFIKKLLIIYTIAKQKYSKLENDTQINQNLVGEVEFLPQQNRSLSNFIKRYNAQKIYNYIISNNK